MYTTLAIALLIFIGLSGAAFPDFFSQAFSKPEKKLAYGSWMARKINQIVALVLLVIFVVCLVVVIGAVRTTLGIPEIPAG